MWWLDSMGALDRRVNPADRARRPETSLQIIGGSGARDVDLPSLFQRGVRLTGRVSGVNGGVVALADDLALTSAVADAGLGRLLHRIDRFAGTVGLDAEIDPPTRLAAFVATPDHLPPTSLDLRADGIHSVIWATGYRRRYPWLHIPVLDAAGEIRHAAGRTAVPGLMGVGMPRQSRRNSTFLDGVRHDAALVVNHLINEVLAAPATRRRAS
jgi:putative flavoprotein involved in K+ transport